MKSRGELQLISDQCGFTNISTECFHILSKNGSEKDQGTLYENKQRSISALYLTRNLCLFGVLNQEEQKMRTNVSSDAMDL